MLKLGEMQELEIKREKDFGVYLEDKDGDSVLLPKKQVPFGKTVGDKLWVFVYKDSKDRWIATSRKPLIQVGEIARLSISDVNTIGAFVNIGLEKDVLIPHREMRYALKKGDVVEVYLYVDKSQRLAATTYTKRHENARRVEGEELKELKYERSAEAVYTTLNRKFEGHLPYTDKSVSAEEVMRDFGISKAEFKRAIGKLLKEGRIKITKTAIFCIY